MAYPYYPTYQPQYPSIFPTNYQPVQQQPYNPVVNQSGIIWVSGLQEAQMYPVAPNNAVALWSRDGKSIYLKQADATGKPSIKTYDLVERAESASGEPQTQDGSKPAYATKDELVAVVGAVKGFDDVIGALKADVESMKSDMYGIAGKKKTVKKKEADEDDE